MTAPEPDPVHLAALVAVAIDVMREARQHIALPSRRLDLERAAAELERALKERAT